MQLPSSVRDSLVEALDEYLEGNAPDSEAVATFTIELLEQHGDELGIDDIVLALEESGALEESLHTTIDVEISSNDEFQCTGEELVSLVERACEVEWDDDATGSDDDDFDDDDEDDF